MVLPIWQPATGLGTSAGLGLRLKIRNTLKGSTKSDASTSDSTPKDTSTPNKPQAKQNLLEEDTSGIVPAEKAMGEMEEQMLDRLKARSHQTENENKNEKENENR